MTPRWEAAFRVLSAQTEYWASPSKSVLLDVGNDGIVGGATQAREMIVLDTEVKTLHAARKIIVGLKTVKGRLTAASATSAACDSAAPAIAMPALM